MATDLIASTDELSRLLGYVATRAAQNYQGSRFQSGTAGRGGWPLVLGMVAAIEIHARQVKANVRREMLGVGAQAAAFVGWLYRDARQPRLSGHWRDRATEWAQEAGDWPMQGYLLFKKRQAAWDERDGLRMLTLAQAAHDDSWQLPPLVQAEVAQHEARGLGPYCRFSDNN